MAETKLAEAGVESVSSNPPTGVYRNKRLMHACTTIVGFTVHLQTKDGSVWEGIFNTFSPEFTICLNLAIQIDPKLNPKDCLYAALKAGSQAEKQAFFDLKDIVRITVFDVDPNYASMNLSSLPTDADISGYDAEKSASNAEHRQLESWQDDGEEVDSLLSLDDGLSCNKNGNQNNSLGWDPQEMFSYNERVHKVTTTYDEKLAGYTVPVPKHGTKEWRKKQERASVIAKEIEGNTKSQSRLAKEADDGDCEEEKFSAVVRQRNVPVTNRQPHPSNPNFKIRPNRPNRSRIESELKHFGSSLMLGPSPRQQVPMPPKQQQSPQSQQQHQTPSQSQHQQSLSGPKLPQQSPSSTQSKQQLPHQPQHQPPHQQPQSQHQQQNPPSKQHQPQSQPQQQHQQSPIQKQQHYQPPQLVKQQHQHQQSLVASQTKPQNQQQSPQQNHQPPQQQQQQQQQQQSQQQSQKSQQHQQPQHQQPQQQNPQQQSQQQSQQQPQQQSQQQPQQQSQQQPQPQQQQQTEQRTQQSQEVSHNELASKSKLNPNAKEFVYKPRTPAISATNPANSSPASQQTMASPYYPQVPIDRANSSPMSQQAMNAPYYQPPVPADRNNPNSMSQQAVTSRYYSPVIVDRNNPGSAPQQALNAPYYPQVPVDPASSSSMPQQALNAPYYPQVPMFHHGLSPHQQQHHATQFMPNHTHPHFQNVHYMSPVPPHFAQQMPQRFVRGNYPFYW